jgi:hypothetical protein
VWLEGLSQLKNPVTSSGIKPVRIVENSATACRKITAVMATIVMMMHIIDVIIF